MGIDIFATATYGKPVAKTRQEVLAFIQTLAPVMPGWPVRLIHEDGSTTSVSLFSDNWMKLEFAEELFQFSARTSNGGPGYHDYVVWFMDQMARMACLTWLDDGGDETNYFKTRDYDGLQKNMADFTSIFPRIADRSFGGAPRPITNSPPAPSQICMSMKMTPLGNHFVSHAQGPWSREELEELANPAGKAHERFFPWWDRSQLSGWFRKKWRHPASLYHKFALELMWNKINWLPPVTDEERLCLSSALSCLEEAWRLEPERTYPVAEWLEMAELSGDEKLRLRLEQRFSSAPPRAEPAIGYLRREVRFNFGPWFLRLPGRVHYQQEESGFESFDDGVLNVKVCSFTITDKESGQPLPAKQWLESEDVKKAFSSARDFPLNTPGISAWIEDLELELVDRPPCANLLTAVMDGSYIRILIYYSDKQHMNAAMDVFRTLDGHIKVKA